MIKRIKKLFNSKELKENIQFSSVLIMLGCIVYNCSSYFEYAKTF